MVIVYRVLGGILLLFGLWGIYFTFKMRRKVHMRLNRKPMDTYQIINKKDYIKAQNTTLLLLDAFLVNMGVLGLYGHPTVLLAVIVPLFNMGFSFHAKKYVKMKKQP